MRAISPKRQMAATGCCPTCSAIWFSVFPREQPKSTKEPVGDSFTEVTKVPPRDASSQQEKSRR